MNFSDLQLHAGILRVVKDFGYEQPTPIQQQAIPAILSGADLRASASTGTGKTAAFLLPALHKIVTAPSSAKVSGPRVLILAPTRELAMQVAGEASKYAGHLARVKTVCIYGGVPYGVQSRELSRPYEILVATPGRLVDFMSKGRIRLSGVEILILDEADRMLDMGFIEPVEQIASATPKTRQTLLFSATLSGSVLDLSKRLLNSPLEIRVGGGEVQHDQIEQSLHYVDNLEHKHSLLEHILTDPAVRQAIVFTATKRLADEVADNLCDLGHAAAALHGDMNQRQRTRTIQKVRSGEIKVLIATDVAARGIDVLTISHVINFDLPMTAEDYVHRIGRTGRAGAKGTALSFVSNKDVGTLRQIERFTKHKLESRVIPGMEPKQRGDGSATAKRVRRFVGRNKKSFSKRMPPRGR